MRAITGLFVAISLVLSPAAIASKSTDTMKACAAAWNTTAAADKAKTTYKDYSKGCLKAGGPSGTTTTSQQRMKDCASKWDVMKKAGTTNGQTYQQFSAKCLKAG